MNGRLEVVMLHETDENSPWILLYVRLFKDAPEKDDLVIKAGCNPANLEKTWEKILEKHQQVTSLRRQAQKRLARQRRFKKILNRVRNWKPNFVDRAPG